MRIPGSNILRTALSVIGKQQFLYYAFIERKILANGMMDSGYAAGVHTQGSVQPVPRSLYSNMGLDFQKNYFNFFLTKQIIDIKRDVSGDQFLFTGKIYQCLSITDWNAVDGWNQVLAIEVPGAVCPC